MKILGIVVLFYPDEKKVIKNILSYLSSLDTLILWDNTPGNKAEEALKSFSSCKLIRMGCGCNVGLGKAYNEAAKYAIENNFTHLLTMDQDSCFKNSSFVDYCKIISFHGGLHTSIYSPNYMQYTGLTSIVSDCVREVDRCQSSGSLISVDIFKKGGIFFLEELIAYGVDSDFCSRARLNGFRVYSVDSIILIHGAGYQKSKRKFLWKTVFPNEYPPLNTYLMIRNFFYLKQIANYHMGEGFCKYYLFKRSVFILCYETNKWKKYKAIILGIYDGIRGNMRREIRF